MFSLGIHSKLIHENGTIQEGFSETIQEESYKAYDTTAEYYNKFLIWFEVAGKFKLNKLTGLRLKRNNSTERLNITVQIWVIQYLSSLLVKLQFFPEKQFGIEITCRGFAYAEWLLCNQKYEYFSC